MFKRAVAKDPVYEATFVMKSGAVFKMLVTSLKVDHAEDGTIIRVAATPAPGYSLRAIDIGSIDAVLTKRLP